MKNRIRFARGTETDFNNLDSALVLPAGVPVYDTTNNKLRVSDGVTPIKSMNPIGSVTNLYMKQGYIEKSNDRIYISYLCTNDKRYTESNFGLSTVSNSGSINVGVIAEGTVAVEEEFKFLMSKKWSNSGITYIEYQFPLIHQDLGGLNIYFIREARSSNLSNASLGLYYDTPTVNGSIINFTTYGPSDLNGGEYKITITNVISVY